MNAEGRVAIGVYQRPVLDDAIPNHMTTICGSDTDVTKSVRSQAVGDTSSDPIETLVESHPVWCVTVPDTIIHLEVESLWRDRWKTILSYSHHEDDNGNPVTSVEPLDDIDGPTVDGPSRFAVHQIDGQDMHRPTRLFGVVTANSYAEAIHTFEPEYTRMRCPANWDFEIIEIAAEREYESSSFDNVPIT